MVVFFERQSKFIRCESRPSDSGSGYDLLVLYPDGREEVEHFEDPAALNRRQVELESSLLSAGWFGPHGQVI